MEEYLLKHVECFICIYYVCISRKLMDFLMLKVEFEELTPKSNQRENNTTYFDVDS